MSAAPLGPTTDLRAPQEGAGLGPVVVADARAGEEDDAPGSRGKGQSIDARLEVVGVHRAHRQPRKPSRQLAGGRYQRLARDVIAGVQARAQRRQQEPDLARLTRARLQHGAASTQRCGDVLRMTREDRGLGAGQIVGRGAADGGKQLAAAGVVEQLGRQRLAGLRQPGHDLVAQRGDPGREIDHSQIGRHRQRGARSRWHDCVRPHAMR